VRRPPDRVEAPAAEGAGSAPGCIMSVARRNIWRPA